MQTLNNSCMDAMTNDACITHPHDTTFLTAAMFDMTTAQLDGCISKENDPLQN